MPSRPPTFKPTARAPVHRPPERRSTSFARGYDKRWQVVSRNYRRKRPLCVGCSAVGELAAAELVDHVIPHEGDQALFWDETNWQGSCWWHHSSIKARLEQMFKTGRCKAEDLRLDSELAMSMTLSTKDECDPLHPSWLKPSAIPLSIICGPPAAGKSTYVRTHASALLQDTIIDLDDILGTLQPGFVQWKSDHDPLLLHRALVRRNEMLASLHQATHGEAWFIVSAPTAAERAWWEGTLGGHAILLHPGVDECKRRAIERGTPLAVQGIDEWMRRSALPWDGPNGAPHAHTPARTAKRR